LGDLVIEYGDAFLHRVDRIGWPELTAQAAAAYIERCTARPAFKRALDAQIGDFKKAA
jgi:glutathione S-transferase